MSLCLPMIKGPALQEINCPQYKNSCWAEIKDLLTPEIEINLYWQQQFQKTLLCSPHQPELLCLGHALLEHCTVQEIPFLEKTQESNYFLSCTSLNPTYSATQNVTLSPGKILPLMQKLTNAFGNWEQTGCFHRAGIYDPGKQKFLYAAEDISRHNCLDRLAGWALNNNIALQNSALFVSARATASLVQKAVKAGFPLLVSRSATTTAALDLAVKNNMTLVGFVRENRFTLFADPEHRVDS